MTARCSASSSLVYSLHFMVSQFAGAGTSGTLVFARHREARDLRKAGNVRQARE